MPETPEHDTERRTGQPDDRRTIVTSERIFQGQREIWIEHDGERYRLRITRRNRLILQK